MQDRECAARVLGLPEDHQVAMVLTFGYPESQESLHRGIVRTPLSELVHRERWYGKDRGRSQDLKARGNLP